MAKLKVIEELEKLFKEFETIYNGENNINKEINREGYELHDETCNE